VGSHRVEIDEDHREEDHVDENADHNRDAAPLKPNDFADTSIYGASRARSNACCVRREACATLRLGLVIAPHVLQVDFDAVRKSII
jgi:hypothetical protein